MSELHYYKVNILLVTLDHYCYAPHKLVGGHLDLQFSVRPSVCPEILCVQLLLHPFMDFVHTHTQ